MKKYLAAGGVAVVAFAFAASAASLNVDAGVLQAGQSDSVECDTDTIETHFGGYESEQAGFVYVDAYDIDAACIGAEVFVEVFHEDGQRIWINDYRDQVDGDVERFRIDDGTFTNGYSAAANNGAKLLLAEDIGHVRIKVQTPHPAA